MRADLHVHSIASDGTLTPEALVRRAIEAGLDVLALADHDSVEGVGEALRAAEGTDLTVVPAVELSAASGDGRDIHVLGYFIDIADPSLTGHLDALREKRRTRAEAMVASLDEAGYRIGLDAVLRLAGGGAVGRSHVARALVEAGYAGSVGEAFDTFIGRGRPFYRAKTVDGLAGVIARVHDAGGLAVLAHPGSTRVDDLLPAAIAQGLDGIEAYHSDHSETQRLRYARFAAEHGLLVTGGSDFHGPGGPNPGPGSVPVPAEAVSAFIEAGRRAVAARE